MDRKKNRPKRPPPARPMPDCRRCGVGFARNIGSRENRIRLHSDALIGNFILKGKTVSGNAALFTTDFTDFALISLKEFNT